MVLNVCMNGMVMVIEMLNAQLCVRSFSSSRAFILFALPLFFFLSSCDSLMDTHEVPFRSFSRYDYISMVEVKVSQTHGVIGI